MQVPERAVRSYTLTCGRCARVWDADYDVLAYHDAGGDHELFFRRGVPAMPPWNHPLCPSCGGQRVSVLPRGFQTNGG